MSGWLCGCTANPHPLDGCPGVPKAEAQPITPKCPEAQAEAKPSTRNLPPDLLAAATLAAARAWCRHSYDYSGAGGEEQLERDARTFAQEPMMRVWVEGAAPVLIAAGRAQAASDVRGYAESLRSAAWSAGSGVVAGEIADAAARIAEKGTE